MTEQEKLDEVIRKLDILGAGVATIQTLIAQVLENQKEDLRKVVVIKEGGLK